MTTTPSCAIVATLSNTLLFRSSQRKRAASMIEALTSLCRGFGAALQTSGHHIEQTEYVCLWGEVLQPER